MVKDIKNYDDLINFVSSLPASVPLGGVVKRKSDDEVCIDPRVEKLMSAEDVMYIFEKYFIHQEDRRKIIGAILNIKIVD